MKTPPKQPPIDNAHVAPGCEPFETAPDYQPTDKFRLCIRRMLVKFASTDAKLTDCENEIVATSSAPRLKREHADLITGLGNASLTIRDLSKQLADLGIKPDLGWKAFRDARALIDRIEKEGGR